MHQSVISDVQAILTISLAISIGVILFILYEQRQKTRLNIRLSGTNKTTDVFLKNVSDRFGLIGAAWKQNIEGHVEFGRLAIENVKLSKKHGLVNTADVPTRVAKKLQLEANYMAGPDRCAVVLPASGGIFFAGRKKLNVRFTEYEVRLLIHEVTIHSAEREIIALQKARESHVAEIQALAEKRKRDIADANAKLYQRFAERASFFRMIAEELEDPLNSFKQSIQDRSLILAEQNKSSASNAIRQLTDLSKELALTGTGAVKTTAHTWISMDEFARVVTDTFKPRCTKKGVSLRTTVAPLNASAAVKRSHLEQIVSNLISNAVAYCPPGADISCSIIARENTLTIRVADTGPGIPIDERPLVFEPFFRATTSQNVKGTGLGLSVVRNIAYQYNGLCQIEDNVPRGTIFVINLKVGTRS